MSETESRLEFLRQFLAERDLPCPLCAYNLRGLESDTCPECSREIRLTELMLPRGKPRKAIPGLACMAAALVGCVYAMTRRFDLFVTWEARAYLAAGLIVLLVGPLVLQAWDYGRRSERAARDVGRAGFVFAGCLLVLVLISVL